MANNINDPVLNDTKEDKMLSQSEAEGLIAVRKVFIERTPLTVNRPFNEQRQLRSDREPYETFYLNITQTAIEFGRYSTVTRFFQIPLIRACVNPDYVHPNPDGTEVKGSHIHIYKEGFLDRFAYPLSERGFTETAMVPFIRAFLTYCNIENIDINEQISLVDGL